MLMARETVTLVRHILRDGADAYETHEIAGASFYGHAQTVLSTSGAKLVSIYQVRIPEGHMPGGVLPRSGDYLVRGTVDNAISRMSDLTGYTYFRVDEVGDNRRGAFPHWRVSGV